MRISCGKLSDAADSVGLAAQQIKDTWGESKVALNNYIIVLCLGQRGDGVHTSVGNWLSWLSLIIGSLTQLMIGLQLVWVVC